MEKELTRTRLNGTKVTLSSSPEEKISAIRNIVENHQYAKIDGVAVDAFSAGAIIAVYDALNDANKKRYASFNVSKMADMAFKLINKGA